MPEPNWKKMIDDLPHVKLEKAQKRIAQLERGIRAIDHMLRLPAAECVPAIASVFTIIDRLRIPSGE